MKGACQCSRSGRTPDLGWSGRKREKLCFLSSDDSDESHFTRQGGAFAVGRFVSRPEGCDSLSRLGHRHASLADGVSCPPGSLEDLRASVVVIPSR